MLRRVGGGWGTFRIIPVESGRGCPYGCEFCTVTGFFGDSIRFRSNESVVNELLTVEGRAKSEDGQIAVFFIDDNFAINVKRTKSLLARHHRRQGAGPLDRANQRQPVARRGTRGPDRRLRRPVDFYRHGVHRPRQSRRREQRLQQAGGVCRRARKPRRPQHLRHHFFHFRHG